MRVSSLEFQLLYCTKDVRRMPDEEVAAFDLILTNSFSAVLGSSTAICHVSVFHVRSGFAVTCAVPSASGWQCFVLISCTEART